MLLSELLHKLRAELDESGQYDKKLVVVTPLCRVFHAEATSQPYCLRLENNMMKFLRAIEKFPLEHAFLKKCQENVHKQIQVALNVSLPKRAWAPINTQRTNIRKNILPVEPRKPSKRKQLNVENVIPLENDWRVQKSQKPNTNSATSQRGFLSRFLGK
jgi:hypothetical protein